MELRRQKEAWRIYNDNNISAKGQAERASEFALSEALRDIIAQEQDREINLKDALGLR
jgi:bacterioferritin